MAKKKSLEDMRDEAYRREDNLASDIDELLDRVNPKNAVNRWKNELLGSVKSFYAAGDGKTAATLPVVVGGVIGVIVLGAGLTAAIAVSRGRGSAKGARAAGAARKSRKDAAREATLLKQSVTG